MLAMDSGSRLTITFNGTGVSWISYRDVWSGVAFVYLDGVLKTTVDTYLAPSQARAVLYNIEGLPRGAWVWVDAFDGVP